MQRDMLYLACTRSTKTYGGVPALGLLINGTVSYFGYIFVSDGNLFHFTGYVWPLMFFVVHAMMVWIVERDPNICGVLEGMFDTGFNRVLWAAPHKLSRRAITSALT